MFRNRRVLTWDCFAASTRQIAQPPLLWCNNQGRLNNQRLSWPSPSLYFTMKSFQWATPRSVLPPRSMHSDNHLRLAMRNEKPQSIKQNIST